MARRHPYCFVCQKRLEGQGASSTMRMTWQGLPGKPEIGMHWPECLDDGDALWREFKDQVRGDPDGKPIEVPRERLEEFLAAVAARNPACLIRNRR